MWILDPGLGVHGSWILDWGVCGSWILDWGVFSVNRANLHVCVSWILGWDVFLYECESWILEFDAHVRVDPGLGGVCAYSILPCCVSPTVRHPIESQ